MTFWSPPQENASLNWLFEQAAKRKLQRGLMNAASQRWSVLAPSSKSISTLLAWQLTSSLQFPALFCLVVVQILLPARFLCLLHKTTETEYRSQHLVNQLTRKKTLSRSAIICWRSGYNEFTRGQVNGSGHEDHLNSWKSRDMFTFLLYTFERGRGAPCVPQE